jgi:uracil-DNA glycosylase family 4
MKTPSENCELCPRLLAYRTENRKAFPDKFNAPVSPFGPDNAPILIVGLAPGLRGANFSGRPFTGDYAGDLLYKTLVKFGLARGTYEARADDGLELVNCRITNAVKCVPPENKPTGEEIKTCQNFLCSELQAMSELRLILALGKIAHDAVLRSQGKKLSAFKFAHNARHDLENGLVMYNSYHCSRYNTQTGRLTEEMFFDVFENMMREIRLSEQAVQAHS